MTTPNDRKFVLARRMRDAVANPPQRAFARELLGLGMSANEVYQLVVRDPAFDAVSYAFRVSVANAARELESERLLKGARSSASRHRAHA